MFLLIHLLYIYDDVTAYFTFHNVSINTVWNAAGDGGASVFTFHNVSINTMDILDYLPQDSPLHSTMFLLIRSSLEEQQLIDMTLHSTMFLLIPETFLTPDDCLQYFTFHNVSINTAPGACRSSCKWSFTFHNVSINTMDAKCLFEAIHKPLHSTMFLLIHLSADAEAWAHGPLHSTMFLLIQAQQAYNDAVSKYFTFHNVSINTMQTEI